MKISPDAFFSFCKDHVPVLRALAEQESELSEAEARRLIRETEDRNAETSYTWRHLLDLQILVPMEARGDDYLMAEPVRRLLMYLFDEARAATPEMIQGYISSLDALNTQLSGAIDRDDPTGVRLALKELDQTLSRIQADIEETHRSILTDVAQYKSERMRVSVREKFQRIVHWMKRYVDPMIAILISDGQLSATFNKTKRLLERAQETRSFDDIRTFERHRRRVRRVPDHAFHVFQQCRLELQPLHDSLRRASSVAQGAAVALERLQRDGLSGWAESHVVPVCDLRRRHAPSASAIDHALRNVREYSPEAPVVLPWDSEDAEPEEYLRVLWLRGLSADLRAALPVRDLLEWLTARHEDKNTADTLAGFACLVFDSEFSAHFTDCSPRSYATADGALRAVPVEMKSST